ncbi:MAG: hypothetical protein E6614_18715 [Bradyrhizobium sp.]|jgi:hypothetical protein|uniref:Uncharacterized protein n=2 Tax=Bradyrhizobium TaxID=374 RepID=A0ABS5G342_9BRAD|nr:MULTISPECIES: hypothetical protein [Bradyrhizobium]RTM03944.1 MAG: hypothetical protein EKK32_07145 [Bradyrhizobiaceae bacterium]MBR1135653.1 hypothetical protein [Bradyrhizobium denitrificans]MCL8482657.1 hypothetical protein [Bradyrhizobium denitrificans]MDU1494750.1 hypothetical protein [Bradyrhizobium sp.]MDU1544871.1 hypothetical protein [Bradyrhizobium sp.]
MAIKALTITLAAAVTTLLTAAASAAPLTAGLSGVPDNSVQQVRMVCTENGRCWREDRGHRTIVREDRGAYGYGRRERRDDDDRGGIGIRAPGVSVGIGRY